ncbi:MAG: MoxR family ATPase [Clostridiales bacterium]|nr:MoxR family ATPase [Clostridiales bacterium]
MVVELRNKLRENIQKVIVGKDEVIDLILVSILCKGHILLEDVPGMGKTLLAKSLAKSIESSFSRVQFTPDLLPSDVVGINYYNQKEGRFVFKKGPVMNQVILADEINRATPKTQSSLLEAMEEHQVTVDGVTYPLEEPFFVIATQNPVETSGTFDLPEAQLDRFFMKIAMAYPSEDEEMKILHRFKEDNPILELKSIAGRDDILEARKAVEKIFVSDAVMNYIVQIVNKTRGHKDLDLGVSPRGTLALFKGAQAYAAIHERDYVLPDDIKRLAKEVLSHRIILSSHSEAMGISHHQILENILREVPVPTENFRKG